MRVQGGREERGSGEEDGEENAPYIEGQKAQEEY